MKYTRAPVSELIMGVCYSSPKIALDKLIDISSARGGTYPLVEIIPPLSVEELSDFQMERRIDPNLTGPMLIRRRSDDRKWLLQLQSDKIFLNWIRLDTEPVGNYIGFSKMKEVFFTELSIIEKLSGIDLHNDIILLDLTYHDRVEWQNYISDLSQIIEIMNFSTPIKMSREGYNNAFIKYTYKDEDINGFGVLNVNTATSVTGSQLLKFEANLRGSPVLDMEAWFGIAHEKQLNIFEKVFSDKIKESWK